MKDIHKDIFIFEQKWKLDVYATNSQYRKGVSIHLRKYPLGKTSDVWLAFTNDRYVFHFFGQRIEVINWRDAKIKLIKLLTDNYEKIISHNS